MNDKTIRITVTLECINDPTRKEGNRIMAFSRYAADIREEDALILRVCNPATGGIELHDLRTGETWYASILPVAQEYLRMRDTEQYLDAFGDACPHGRADSDQCPDCCH